MYTFYTIAYTDADEVADWKTREIVEVLEVPPVAYRSRTVARNVVVAEYQELMRDEFDGDGSSNDWPELVWTTPDGGKTVWAELEDRDVRWTIHTVELQP